MAVSLRHIMQRGTFALQRIGVCTCTTTDCIVRPARGGAMTWRFLICAVTFCFLTTSGSAAATLSNLLSNEGKIILILDGEISAGDADDLKNQIQLANDQGKLVSGVRLNSMGGNLLEGAKLAEIVRYARIATVVANGARCASACFIVFAAGNEKYASHSAFVGVHGASDERGRETVEAGAATVSMARLVKNLGVPENIIGKMVITPPDRIIWLTPDELRSMGTTMTGKPIQVAPATGGPYQLPGGLHASTKADDTPTWSDFVEAATKKSEAQNKGRAQFHRSCQPELKICHTGLFFKGNDGKEMLIKSSENMSGKVFRREVCEFNEFKDIRLCLNWDTGEKSRDMRDNDGSWRKIADE